jgi:hypothetical protein
MTITARQFSSPEALKSYLQKHPKADPSKHSVKPKGEAKKPKDEAKKDEAKKDEKPKSEGGKPKSKIDEAIDEAIQEFLGKQDLTEGQKKRVLEQALSDSETESKGEPRKKVKDYSKEEGFEALEGLSSAEQRKVIEKALKMANTRIQELREQAVRIASTDPKAAYDLLERTAAIDEPDRWVVADEILQQGVNHPAFREITRSWDEFARELDKAGKQEKALIRSGVGRTEADTILHGQPMKKLKAFQDMVDTIISQIEQKTRR